MSITTIKKDAHKEFDREFEHSRYARAWAKDFKAFLDKQLDIAYEAGKDKEVCICAAVKFKNGMVVRGQRHGDCFYTARRIGIASREEEQGFITSKNRFVGRQEGRKLQDRAGIESKSPEGYVADTLFSEDLY